jgi:3-oxoacyl-[acyl-carrier-protein] synthase-3
LFTIQKTVSLVGELIPIESFFESSVDLEQFKKGAGFKSVSRFGRDLFDEARDLCRANSDLIAAADLIIVVSQHVIGISPPPSSHILEQFDRLKCLVIDLNSGCSGFIEALTLASRFLNPDKKNALIICADSYPSYSDGTHRNVDAVFGEAITITHLTYSSTGAYHFDHAAWPKLGGAIKYNLCDKQMEIDGALLIQSLRTDFIPEVKGFLTKHNIDQHDLSQILVHQGSKFVIEHFRIGMGLNNSQCRFTAGQTGNCNSSSLPLQLASLDQLPSKLCMVSFGVGIKLSIGLLTTT